MILAPRVGNNILILSSCVPLGPSWGVNLGIANESFGFSSIWVYFLYVQCLDPFDLVQVYSVYSNSSLYYFILF